MVYNNANYVITCRMFACYFINYRKIDIEIKYTRNLITLEKESMKFSDRSCCTFIRLLRGTAIEIMVVRCALLVESRRNETSLSAHSLNVRH